MQENQIKVINWIRSGMDYSEGIGLLVELTHKPMYSDLFTGREKPMTYKLAYEICKAARLADHVSWKNFIRKVKEENGIEIVVKKKELPNKFPNVKLPEFIPLKENKLKVFDPDSPKTIETTGTTETIQTNPLARCQDKTRSCIPEAKYIYSEGLTVCDLNKSSPHFEHFMRFRIVLIIENVFQHQFINRSNCF